jgi:hypothetical protein
MVDRRRPFGESLHGTAAQSMIASERLQPRDYFRAKALFREFVVINPAFFPQYFLLRRAKEPVGGIR